MAANSVPGISVAVVQDGELVWSQSFGMADLENFVPATSATLFRLGSISKPITATAILQLSERGKLDLDAEVQKYCPAFPKKEWPITTRELLGRLSGIRHYHPDGKGDIPEDSAKHFANMEESLQIFAADALVAKPGTKFHYSTYGYALGWGTQKKYGLALVEHTGGQQGTSTSIILVPERRAGSAVLANMERVDSAVLSTDILKIALDLKD
jgi:CubicO group peptidase (beta-lactamase class C family)